jgi:hypothetical protein
MVDPRRNGASMTRCCLLWLMMGCANKTAPPDGPSATDSSATDTAHTDEPVGFRHIAVVETSSGKLLVTNGTNGEIEGEICLRELYPDLCGGHVGLENPCLMFGTDLQADGSLLLTYTLRDPSTPVAPGAISLVEPGHPPTTRWTIHRLTMPDGLQVREGLNCVADPATPGCHLYGAHNTWIMDDGTLLVSDTSNSRILWLQAPSGDDAALVESILSTSHPQWETERYPNQVQALDIDGSPHLLITFKAHAEPGGATVDEGSIVLWNVSDRSQPERIWTFPEEGGLAAVHQAWVADTPDGKIMLYAHSRGAQDDARPDRYGSIGFAAFNGRSPPEYLADGILPSPGLGFTREIEWDSDTSQLLVVDSGCENAQDDCGRTGHILAIEWPVLSPSGKSGAFSPTHENQTFIELELQQNLMAPPLRFPFDVDPLKDDQLVGIGLCE